MNEYEAKLRDDFAAMAIAGLCASPGTRALSDKEIADAAYRVADAMLEARKK